MDWVDELRPEKCLFRGLPNQKHSIEASAWRRLTNEQDSNNIDKLFEINEGLIRDVRLRVSTPKTTENFPIWKSSQNFNTSEHPLF